MEILLAIVVISAVIFFGALISLGNERQRRAIDHLHEQITLWAMRDLMIKREELARNVKVDSPLGWLNKVASQASGEELGLQVVEVTCEPTILVCHSQSKNHTVYFCTSSPADIRKASRFKHNRLTLQDKRSLLFWNADHGAAYELSILNAGILFDVELPLAWYSLTGIKAESLERLWMYVVG